MTARRKRGEASLARLLAVLARRNAAIRIATTPIDEHDSKALAGLILQVPAEVLARAEQSGLVGAEDGLHRILPAGVAWLRRRLSGGDGYADQHRELGLREIKSGGERNRLVVNDQESPLAWLRRRAGKSGQPILSDAQFEAGERLRGDFWHAGMTPRVTASWNGGAATARSRRGAPGDAASLRDSVAGAQQRVRRALEAVGPELAGILIDVCCHLKGIEASEGARGWPQRSGKVVLVLALSRLARHYGLLGPEAPPPSRRSTLSHWGDAGYRPTLASWQGSENEPRQE
jgi:hypothetical protein